MLKISTLFLLVLAASPSQSVTDRSCGSDLTRLWLDIVFVVDNSKNMNLYNVYNTISALFIPLIQIGTGYDDPRSTRVGFLSKCGQLLGRSWAALVPTPGNFYHFIGQTLPSFRRASAQRLPTCRQPALAPSLPAVPLLSETC
ncbi:hypothetical protein B9Z55_005077 [Caenorhabditis nigoni]|uniref:VWFA domain-containing protein n=1 Tax=Caenorhabditis nigoni TaxID=1611254 RepID=A0A2G5UZ98_9PELO|nr:hypothetical protein B9Z55_005077 [Caenorhabditis nigoni]